jgi:hypothetical protein
MGRCWTVKWELFLGCFGYYLFTGCHMPITSRVEQVQVQSSDQIIGRSRFLANQVEWIEWSVQ